jgi:hypothetical protein
MWQIANGLYSKQIYFYKLFVLSENRILLRFKKNHTFMKKLLTFSTIVMIGLVVLSSCSKKSSSPSYLMTATVGATAFSGSNTYALTAGTDVSIFSYTGSGTTATPPYLEIVMPNFTGTGTYTFDSTLLSNTAGYYESSTSAKVAKSGSVIITSSSSTSISGTFSFTTTDGTVVSNGKFTAKKS